MQTSLARFVELLADLLGLALAVCALLALVFAIIVLLLISGTIDDVLLVGVIAFVAVGAVARVAHLEALHRLAVGLALGALSCALAGALLTCRDSCAGRQSRRKKLVELVLLSLVLMLLDETPNRIHQDVKQRSGCLFTWQSM